MICETLAVLAAYLHGEQELLRLKAVGENDGICCDVPSGLGSYPSLKDLRDRIVVDQLHVVAMQAQKIVGIIDSALTTNLCLWHEEIAILFGRVLTNVVGTHVGPALSNGAARVGVEAAELALLFPIDLGAIQTHGQGDPSHSPLEEG